MTLSLQCHPDFPADAITAIDVDVEFDGSGQLILEYIVVGDIQALDLLNQTEPKRTDYLWQKTCFEAFVGAKGESGYLELNLSPSTEWAVYVFDDHRRGMSNPELVGMPVISISQSHESYCLRAHLDLRGLPGMTKALLEFAATAVIEEQNGRKSLWALAHPSGNPDFHNRDCFVHQLEAVAAT